MRIDGQWYLCDDGLVRPIMRGEIRSGDGSWFKVPFLVDSGADRTVFSADVLADLRLLHLTSSYQLSGVGGQVKSVVVNTQIRMEQDEGSKAVFTGEYAGFTDPAALDMSVLGRDLLNLFALVIDRQRDVVCLLGQSHSYRIEKR